MSRSDPIAGLSYPCRAFYNLAVLLGAFPMVVDAAVTIDK